MQLCSLSFNRLLAHAPAFPIPLPYAWSGGQMHAALIRRHQRLGNDCARAPLLCWWEKRRLPPRGRLLFAFGLEQIARTGLASQRQLFPLCILLLVELGLVGRLLCNILANAPMVR